MSVPRYRLVLTGASGGIGAAIAGAVAGECAAMVLAGRDAERLAALRCGLESAHPGLAVAVVAGDLSSSGIRSRVCDAARAMPGGPDVLINNAGVSGFHEFESQRGDDLARLIEVNLVVPMQLAQALLPLLRAAPRAQIVNVGSVFGYLGYPGFAAYCASKFGLRGFSQALRRELADTGVTVRYFAPRATRTSLNSPAVAAMNRELKVREDRPEDVGRALARFLATREWERKLGLPERLYVLLNRLVPGVNDGAIRAQLATIRKHLPGASGHPPAAGERPAR